MKRSTNLRQTILNSSKKVALMVAILLTLATSYSFAASGDSITGEIRTSFKKDFQNARIINTEVRKGFTKLTFRMNDMVMFAFYTEEGQLLAVTRNIVSTQLPIVLQHDLKADYNGFWITELIEFTGDSEDSYYVALENANTKVVLRSNGNSWEVFSTTEKQ